MQFNSPQFTPNDKVEIIKSSSNSSTSFYPATIILQETQQPKKTPKKRKKTQINKQDFENDDDELEQDEEDQLFMVEYKTPQNDIVAYVKSSEIRPVPPQFDAENRRSFDKSEKVDVLINGCWKKGEILGVLYEGLRYLVRIDGDDVDEDVPIEVSRSSLRVHRDWFQGSWVPPFDNDEGAISKPQTIAEVRTDANGKNLKLRIKGTKRLAETTFSPGTAVEVKSDEAGYEGSWYSAIVVGSAGVGKFLVEYQTLKTEDEMELLKEIANEQDMRPCPPKIQQSNRYKVLEEVDAWYNDGWWEGMIYEVLGDGKYTVYFAATHEKLVYQHSDLRPHQSWVDGNWVRASLKSRMEMNLAAEEALQESSRAGMMVEVRSNRLGYGGSWYAAFIIRSTAKDKFLVEYDSLKANYEKQPLQEEVSVIDVRPLPPCDFHVRRYKQFEEVDAWCAGGWWVGAILDVLNSKKYIVHFASTGNNLELDHVYLRPHQDWIDGKWIRYKHRSPVLKLRSSSSEKKSGQTEAYRRFYKGTIVEVRSDEPGYEGAWYSAVIVKSTRKGPKGRYLVEYLTLKTEDNRRYLREEAEIQNIRPCPPMIIVNGCYFLLEKVDAWHNDGWWEGVISKILADKKYMVYFETSREELRFDHVNLRTRQEWIHGTWITVNKDTGLLVEKLVSKY